jgi:hypothetical protein
MKGIVYISRAAVPFDVVNLDDLATRSQRRNAERGITGYLFFEDDYFVQYLEGPELAVDDLTCRIRRDPRHEVLHLLDDGNLAKRRFPGWHMRWVRRRQHIALENILSDHLLWIRSLTVGHRFPRDSAWSMVDSIARLQARLESLRANPRPSTYA